MGPRAGLDIMEKRKTSPPSMMSKTETLCNKCHQTFSFQDICPVKLHKVTRSKHSIGMRDNLGTIVDSVSHGMYPVEHRAVF